MNEQNEYPTLELSGKTYTVKFSKGSLLYNLSKTGTNLSDLGGPKGFSTVIDVLAAALSGQFTGTPGELAEVVVAEGKIASVNAAITQTLAKVFPPTAASLEGMANSTPQ